MSTSPTLKVWHPRALLSLFLVAYMSIANSVFSLNVGDSAATAPTTATPIHHVIVLIGENRTFDHIFATYVPRSGDSVSNLRTKGIVNADGTPGPRFSKAAQFQAVAPYNTTFFISLGSADKVP
jgi:phospholipase C